MSVLLQTSLFSLICLFCPICQSSPALSALADSRGSLPLPPYRDETTEIAESHRLHFFVLTVSLLALLLHPDFSRKEVFQPHLPVRLPCYDLAPITCFTLGRSLRARTSGTPDFHGLTGGVYKARERIHRAMADARLLANPASWGRVADPNPN